MCIRDSYYVVKRPAYSFLGETHNYYELTFVDQGSLDTTVDGKSYTIGMNKCMLYMPCLLYTSINIRAV